jgi:hypothetical protein
MRGIECQTLALAFGDVKQRGNPATVAAITLDQWRGIQADFDKLAILAGKAQLEALLRLHALPHRIHGGAHLLMIAGWPEHMRRPLPTSCSGHNPAFHRMPGSPAGFPPQADGHQPAFMQSSIA